MTKQEIIEQKIRAEVKQFAAILTQNVNIRKERGRFLMKKANDDIKGKIRMSVSEAQATINDLSSKQEEIDFLLDAIKELYSQFEKRELKFNNEELKALKEV